MLDKQGTGIPALVEEETTLAKLSILVEISLLNQSSKLDSSNLDLFDMHLESFFNNF